MTDLDKLIEAVEAGTLHEMPYGGMPMATKVYRLKDSSILAAYHGSLDAAKALHEALLPGWEWSVSWVGAMVGGPNATTPERSEHEFWIDNSDNPARAWLLAILKAYRAQVTA